MERTNAELQTVTPHAVETEKNMGGSVEVKKPFGKFDSADSLLKAYESLEAEFTRRSQKLKAIEGELSKRSELDKTQTEAGVSCGNDEDIYGKYPLAQNRREEIETKISGFSHSKTPRLDAYVNTLEELLTLAENKLNEKENLPEKDFSDEIVKEYLKKVALSRPRAVISGGTVLSAPPNKPTSIAEASAIAKNYLKRKGE